MATVVLSGGKLELPVSVRQKLRLNDGDTLELDVSGDAILLRPVDDPTPEEREHIRRGVADVAAGRVRHVDEDDLLALIDPADRP